MVPLFKNAGERYVAKCHPVSLLSVVDNIFEKLVKISLLVTLRNKAFFLISSMVSEFLIKLSSK